MFHSLPRRAFIMPRVIECPGVQELYGDVLVAKDHGEIFRLAVAVQQDCDVNEAEQVLSIVMRRSGFLMSLACAGVDFLPPGAVADPGAARLGMLQAANRFAV